MSRRHVPRHELTPTEAAAEREMRRDPFRRMSDERLAALAEDLRWRIREYEGTVAADAVPSLRTRLERVEREQAKRRVVA